MSRLCFIHGSRNSGRATVIISKVHITAVVTVSRDETGHPSLSLETCYAAIGDLDIQLDEAASWIYRYFASFLKNPTLDSLNNALCPYIKDEIQRMSVEFREHPAGEGMAVVLFRKVLRDQNHSECEAVQAEAGESSEQNQKGSLSSRDYFFPIPTALIQIDQFAQIENSLTDSPTVYMTHIDLDLKGTVYPVGNDTDTMPPFKPASFMLPDVNDSMMYVGVSEYFFQTASLAYFTSGAFNVPVAKELSAYFRFTTDTFSSLIPMIAKRYAEPHPVIMNLVATAAPVVMLHPGRFILQFAGSMDVLVALPNSTTQSLLFTLNITANTHARLTIFEKKLLPALCLDSFHFSLARSNVGFFRVSLLENFLSYVLQNGVFQMVNGLLKKGFPLPNLDKFILMESAVKVHQGYVLISTDFKM
ncbi:BPI fold-containing family C protein [Tiliqua scincoides]|uniref:BPI fold-containing family C protein n=1 Tax=Tiliqua scincoides TaxID=71010 RepID=UPI003461AC81